MMQRTLVDTNSILGINDYEGYTPLLVHVQSLGWRQWKPSDEYSPFEEVVMAP